MTKQSDFYLGTYDDIQEYVQVQVAHMKLVVSGIRCLFPIVYLLFLGPWSDQFGRKPVMLAPVFGFILQNAIFLLSSIYFEELSADFIMLEAFRELFGGPQLIW